MSGNMIDFYLSVSENIVRMVEMDQDVRWSEVDYDGNRYSVVIRKMSKYPDNEEIE